MKICPKCGKQYNYDMSFCLEDGSHLEAFAETTDQEVPSKDTTPDIIPTEKTSEMETVNLPNPKALPTDPTPLNQPTSENKRPDTAVTNLKDEIPLASSNQPASVKAQIDRQNTGKKFSAAFLLVPLILIVAIGGGIYWMAKVIYNKSVAVSCQPLTKLTKVQIETFFKDASPAALKNLAENPEIKKKWVENIKQLLAVAAEACKSDIGQKPETLDELEAIRAQMIATAYDKEKNKDKAQTSPFGAISKEDVDKYYQTPGNKEKVDKILKSKIDEAKAAGTIPKDQEVPEEQINQFKEQYAKTQIYYKEATDNWSKLSEDFKQQAELQAKIQQAQYLARTYAEKYLAKQVEVKDEEIPQYLAAHPDADPDGTIKKYLTDHPIQTKEQKKAKADDLLKRAKAGEDFAKLATENSEDPGSKNDGGLYKDIPMGQMTPEFEKAALALEPGQITSSLVETKYGYHIIKLERKGKTKDKEGKESDTYDARHILIMTTSDDPQSPLAPVKQKIEADKEKKILDDIAARNPIEVAEDFEVKVPPMPEGQPNGLPPGVKMDPKQLEELQRQMKEAQNSKKPEPKKN